ncbi:MAG: hypothetical protein JNL36_08355 [Candidatus Kapabacteria bacterium]|nr:hypothetical protein [Candidatus Kapabacteria bacterium]
MSKFVLTLVIVLICSCSEYNLYSQAPNSTKGKRFYFAWPSIDGNDSTFCFFSITSTKSLVQGYVKTNDTTINFFDQSISSQFSSWIHNINKLRVSRFNRYIVSESEVVENKGVYVESVDTVTIHLQQVNHARLFDTSTTWPTIGEPIDKVFMSEFTTLYPIESLAKDYTVITKSDPGYASQFLIIATEDSTEVEIVPSKSTEKGKPAGIPFTVLMQKGQTYLVRSPLGDLTGSKITSIGKFCRPIAIIVGSPKTTIDAKVASDTIKKNVLLEQLPPFKLIGNRYITPIDKDGTEFLIRIMALQPQTTVQVEGIQVGGMLSAGEFVDIHTDSVMYISSQNPIVVAQFSKSRTLSSPTMIILPSLNQFQNKSLTLRNLNIWHSTFMQKPIKTVLIARTDTRNLTKISSSSGGNLINNTNWKTVPGNPLFSTYTFNNPTEQPRMFFNLNSGLLAFDYGFNQYQSYAYSGGAYFGNTIFGGIDSTGIYANTSYCQKGISNFGAFGDTTATRFLWEFGDGGKGEGKTVENIYQNAGQYALKLIIYRDAFCSYDTVRKNITVRASPVIKAGTKPTVLLCNGQTALLGTIQLPGVTYRWSPAIGLSDTTVGQPTVTATFDSVKYFVRGYDSFGCETRDSIVVKLYDQPIANAGPDTVSCGGNGVQIGRQTTGGTPNYSFLWTPSDGLSNDKIERPIAAPSTNTTYILRVTDANGCMGYDTVNIQALPAPTITLGTAPTICEGDSVQLVASGAPTYRWVNARNINDTTIGNPTVYPSVTTTYYVAGLFETGCVALDSVLVNVTPKPRLPIAFQTTACPNATKTYTVENRGDLTYNWEVTGGNLTTGQGSNEATIVWGAGPTGSIKLTTTTTAGSCSFDTTVNITISSDIKPTITESKKNTVVPSLGTVRICPNESVTLDVGVGYTEISWTNGSTSRQTTVSSEGWIGVSVKDATGCSGGDSVYVEVALPPVIFAGNDRVLCGTDTAVMRGNVNGSGTYRYQWIPPTAVSDPTSLVTNFIAPTTTNLIFQAIDTVNGCISSDTVLMTILSISNDIITTSKGNNILCFGEQMTLDAGAFDSYIWSTGETSRTINISTGGTYWVDAKSGSCSAIDSITIIQNPQIVVIPTPDITASPGATVTLDANATGGTLPYQFQWTPNVNFVDPTTVQSPRVTASVGSQTYIVTITDANDCVARDTITVFVPSTATTVTVARRDVSATAFGERFPITATLTPNTPITPTGFTATITVPFEQFIPKSVTNGTLTVTQTPTDYVININVPLTEPIQNGDVITELIGDILLGQQDSTPIVLTNAQWTGTTYPVTTQNGRIVLNDVCYSGTRRYLLPTTVGFGILSVHPNPANTKATFEFGIIEAGQTTFEIIDVFGNVVHSTSWTRQPATPKGGSDDSRTTHTVDVSNLPSGTYYGVLKSFSQRESVPLVITR